MGCAEPAPPQNGCGSAQVCVPDPWAPFDVGHCIEKSGVTNNPSDLDADRDRIRGCLAGLKNFPGVAGEITMDENRDGAGSSAILKVVGGKYVNVSK